MSNLKMKDIKMMAKNPNLAYGAAVGAIASSPLGLALAATGQENLNKVMDLLSQGVIFLGGVLIVFGCINLGMTIKDGMQGGGGQLSGSIAMIVGGAIVAAAGAWFSGMGNDLFKVA